MKIVGVDNLARETVADVLIEAGIPDTPEYKRMAEKKCYDHNNALGDGPGAYWVVKEDDYRLSRGMADLV